MDRTSVLSFFMAKLVWTVSGDEIPLTPCNNALYEYFVNQLDVHGVNRYSCKPVDIDSSINELEHCLHGVNSILTSKFNLTSLIIEEPNWLDQNLINELHRRWVKLHCDYPSIEVLCEQIDSGSSDKFYRINKLLHHLESAFDSVNLTNDLKFFPNIFDEDITTFGKTNLMIDFNNLGRTTFNKWVNFDSVVNDVDTNDFNELWTALTLNLSKPYSSTPPNEYVEWASRHNRRPSGESVGLANIIGLEDKLLEYREVVTRNSHVSNNYITLRN